MPDGCPLVPLLLGEVWPDDIAACVTGGGSARFDVEASQDAPTVSSFFFFVFEAASIMSFGRVETAS
jgi:hypothetical protein